MLVIQKRIKHKLYFQRAFTYAGKRVNGRMY